MTTVAYRDGVIAVDTLGVSNSGMIRETKKLHRIHGAIIGLSGVYDDCLTFVDWWERGHDMAALPQFILYRGAEDAPDFHAIVLDAAGVYLWTEHFQPSPIHEPFFSLGSGAMAARAAMHMGASAERAVEVAMKVDLHTGGRVESERLK